MDWDQENLKRQPPQVAGGGLLDLKIGRDGINIPSIAQLAEEIGLGEHREVVGMIADLAAVLAFDQCRIPDVINMSMGEQENLHPVSLGFQPLRATLRSVDENAVGGEVKAVR